MDNISNREGLSGSLLLAVSTTDLFTIVLEKAAPAVPETAASEAAVFWTSPVLFDGCFFFFLRLDVEMLTADLLTIALGKAAPAVPAAAEEEAAVFWTSPMHLKNVILINTCRQHAMFVGRAC